MPRRQEAEAGILILALLVIGLGVFLYIKLARYPENLTLFSATWQRAIHTEQFTTLNEDTAARNMPGDAYNRFPYQRYIPDTCYRTAYREEEVWTGKRYTEEEESYQQSYDCSYYETWVKYNINRWVHYQDLVTNGNIQQDRVWAEFTPSGTGDVIGNIRESSRDESLYITFLRSDGKRTIIYQPTTVEVWQSMSAYLKWTINFNRTEEPIWADLKHLEGNMQ